MINRRRYKNPKKLSAVVKISTPPNNYPPGGWHPRKSSKTFFPKSHGAEKESLDPIPFLGYSL